MLQLGIFQVRKSYRWRLWTSSRLARTVSGACWGVLKGAIGLSDQSVAGIRILLKTFSSSEPIKSVNIARCRG